MLTFLHIMPAILLCLCHRQIIFAALMALDETLQIYRRDTAYIHSKPKCNIFTLPPLPFIAEEVTAKTVMTFSMLIDMLFTTLGIVICIRKR